MINLKSIKSNLFVFFVSAFISIILLIIFRPILIAQDIIFPYCIHPFNIAKKYAKIWLYIKFIYCCNLFIVNFIITHSIFYFFSINKKVRPVKHIELDNYISYGPNLLIGVNSENKEKIFIPEKGLYQNILITGTIGSRKNEFCNVPIFKATYAI